mgnify:CR=1 FL=1
MSLSNWFEDNERRLCDSRPFRKYEARKCDVVEFEFVVLPDTSEEAIDVIEHKTVQDMVLHTERTRALPDFKLPRKEWIRPVPGDWELVG